MTPRAGQRRGRSIAMTKDELDTFLSAERVCRVASLRSGRAPNISAFVVCLGR
jgi:hypothetical protein